MGIPINLATWPLDLHYILKQTSKSTLQFDLSAYTILKHTSQSVLQIDLSTYTIISNGHPNQYCKFDLSTYTIIPTGNPNQACNLTSQPTQESQMDTPINLAIRPLDLHNYLKWTPQSTLLFDLSTYTIISKRHPNQLCNLTSRLTQ